MAAMSEFDTGGSSSPPPPPPPFEDGSRSSDTPTESSSARNCSRGEYPPENLAAPAPERARPQASRRAEVGMASRAETAWSEVVCAWQRRRATATASSSARAASSVKHCLAMLTGVGIAGKHIYYKNNK
ncbi:hypothetical protein V8G54_035932 [Vigna mungo]|uniref:Uncharacterized protein n=1 Tax=Vigna mungo TaxID=3915 RepID=A0AAQ3REY3_VIGMU